MFFIYENMDLLNSKLTEIELVRYIYIGTFVKQNGVLKLDNNKTIMDKKRLKELLQIKDVNLFNKYFKKLIENDLLLENENAIIVNPAYFYRGGEREYKKLTGLIKFDENFTRLYITTTRELYENTENKKRKQLHIVYKLLPYVNGKYNILCKNTKELDKEKIEHITISKIMDILKYNKSQMARFRKDFYSIKVNNGYVFKSVQGHDGYLNSMVIVNPKIYYKGDNIEEVQELLALFK